MKTINILSHEKEKKKSIVNNNKIPFCYLNNNPYPVVWQLYAYPKYFHKFYDIEKHVKK